MYQNIYGNPGMTPAEEFLQVDQKIPCRTNPDGTIDAWGDIKIISRGLKVLPDLSKVRLQGNFDCTNNSLGTLWGAPASVSGDFICDKNNLSILAGAPKTVGGTFSCRGNNLWQLEGGPESAGRYDCTYNRLTVLDGAPVQFSELVTDFGTFTAPGQLAGVVVPPPAPPVKRAKTGSWRNNI